MWLTVHGRDSIDDAAQRAERADLRARVALDHRLSKASDADQQAYAERLS